MKGIWETTSGGGEVLAAIAPTVIIGAISYAVVGAVTAIPVWVLVAAPVTITAVAAAFLRALVHHNRQEASKFTARCDERRAIEAAEAEERRADRLAVQRDQAAITAAQAPVIHNHVYIDPAAIAAMARGYAPTVITGAEEIER